MSILSAGDFALGVIAGRALKDIAQIAPALHLTIYSDAELDALEGDLLAAIRAEERLLDSIAGIRNDAALRRQEAEENGEI